MVPSAEAVPENSKPKVSSLAVPTNFEDPPLFKKAKEFLSSSRKPSADECPSDENDPAVNFPEASALPLRRITSEVTEVDPSERLNLQTQTQTTDW